MSFKLTILGSSGALPAYGRFPSSQHLSIHNRSFLIDCGEGSQMQLAHYSLSMNRISHIFISHLHGDHYLGLAGLIFSMHLQKRESDLHLYSFPGLDEILLAHLRHAKSVLNFKIVFHPLNEHLVEVIYEDDKIAIETIPLAHKIRTSGFLFREKPKPRNINKEKIKEDMMLQHIVQLKAGHDVKDEKGNILYRSSDYTLPAKPSVSYAYCSDTQPSAGIVQQIIGVDYLYHEATFMDDEKGKARETRHSTAAEAAETAQAAGVKKLLIGHISARYKNPEDVLAEARSIFKETYLAMEGEVFDLN